MKIQCQRQNVPSQILFGFDQIVMPQTTCVRWAVAYTTYKGAEMLTQRVIPRMGARVWQACPKEIITSFDFGLTQPEALSYLRETHGFRVLIANSQLAANGNLRPSHAFHPKFYLFYNRAAIGYMAGSANLTKSALSNNTEVAVCGQDVPTGNSWDQTWQSLVPETVELTDLLLEQYRSVFRRAPQQSEQLDVVSIAHQPETIHAQDTLWNSIQRNNIDPTQWEHFWVEAGSMSSGGSHNQLELPRGANVFFGFNHSDYGDDHVVIGYPRLTLNQLAWRDRPLTWHGNNKM